jgi:hypothetical protein
LNKDPLLRKGPSGSFFMPETLLILSRSEMTVSILSTAEKAVVGQLYKQRFHTMVELAAHFNVSTTTIHSVLRELGITKKKPVLSVEQGQALHFIKAHGLTLKDLYSVFGPVETKGTVHHAN